MHDPLLACRGEDGDPPVRYQGLSRVMGSLWVPFWVLAPKKRPHHSAETLCRVPVGHAGSIVHFSRGLGRKLSILCRHSMFEIMENLSKIRAKYEPKTSQKRALRLLEDVSQSRSVRNISELSQNIAKRVILLR